MRAKMTDVALLAGVSTSTVSHVINKTRFVSEETAQKVMDAIAQLDYTPDVSARVLKSGKKLMIGFIVPDISNPVFSLLIECVENIVSEHGFRLVISNTRDSIELERNAIRSLSSGVADGLIVTSSARSIEDISDCIPAGFPIIFVDRELKDFPQDSIVMDCHDATLEMLESLIDAGHKKIGYVVGVPQISATQDRVRVYEEAFSNRNLPYEKSMIRYLERSKGNVSGEITDLLESGCTAVIGTHTMITHDILNYIESSPEMMEKNICVCGFSDSYMADRFKRKIPVVDEPVAIMGNKAGEMILAKIADQKRAFPVEKVPCKYIPNKK